MYKDSIIFKKLEEVLDNTPEMVLFNSCEGRIPLNNKFLKLSSTRLKDLYGSVMAGHSHLTTFINGDYMHTPNPQEYGDKVYVSLSARVRGVKSEMTFSYAKGDMSELEANFDSFLNESYNLWKETLPQQTTVYLFKSRIQEEKPVESDHPYHSLGNVIGFNK